MNDYTISNRDLCFTALTRVTPGQSDFYENTKPEAYSPKINLSELIEKVVTLQKQIQASPQLKVVPLKSQDRFAYMSLERSILFRLTKAIHYKRKYYDNTFMGRLTKVFLKIIGQWNKGNTNAIAKATQAQKEAFDKIVSSIKDKCSSYKEIKDSIKKERETLKDVLIREQIFASSDFPNPDNIVFPWESKEIK